MRAAVDLKFDGHGRRGRPGIIERTGSKTATRKRGQEQRRGSGLDYRTAGNLECIRVCIGFVFVHDCSISQVGEGCLRERRQRYGQVSPGRLMTMGVAVLRTTTHRNGSSVEGLISMCGRKAGT